MDIHKPKPVHSLREFLSEIVVVVCGILIALGLEEGLRALRDRETSQAALEVVRGEVRQDLSYVSARLATLPCVERRLDEIGDLLQAAGEGPLKQTPRWIGEPPIFFLTDQRWQATTASGRASLLSAEEQGRFAGFYAFIGRFVEGERAEQAAWSQLRGLESWRGPLGQVGRVHFLEALQAARYEIWQTRVTAAGARIRAKELGIGQVAPQTMMNGYRLPHGVCLPIDTPRDKAVDILTREGGPPFGHPK